MDLNNLKKDDLKFIITQMRKIEKNNQNIIDLLTAKSESLNQQVSELKSELDFFRNAIDLRTRMN